MIDDNFKGDIEELDISELKKKKIKSGIKKAVVGIIIAGVLVSAIPNAVFYSNLFFSKHNSEVVKIVESNNYSYKDKAKILLENGIAKNINLSEKEKNDIISSFEKFVIENYSDSFTEKYLYNMYTSAVTVNVNYIPDYVQNYSWWDGDFNSYTNSISIPADKLNDESNLLAHEFLHASLKKGLFGSGLTSGINGYGYNEGLTSSYVVDDYSYNDEYYMVCYLGCILGIDKVQSAYFNCDLDSIKKELNKYLSNKETERLIKYCDDMVFTNYLYAFQKKLGIDFRNTYIDLLVQYEKESIELLKKAFVNKTGLSVTDSSYGRLLFGKGSLVDDSSVTEPFYYITFADAKNYSINVFYIGESDYYSKSYVVADLSNFDIDKALEDITKMECKSSINSK